MVFANNKLTLTHESSGFTLDFSSKGALKCVDESPKAGDVIRVSYAQLWNERSSIHKGEIKDVVKPYDWTYTPQGYVGSTIGKNGGDEQVMRANCDTPRMCPF